MYNRNAQQHATRALIQEAFVSLAGEKEDARLGEFEAALAFFLTLALPAHVVTLVQLAATELRLGHEGQGFFYLCAALAPYRAGWIAYDNTQATPLLPLFNAFWAGASPAMHRYYEGLDYEDKDRLDVHAEDEYAGVAGLDPRTGQRWDDTLYEGPFAD